ncbi:hypothetical protein [Dubosiella newyorkensis]|uniref:hypothetical protein n=1 Tax=Dubosiella newyorkensis TaxID=1862672 RepID=UPI003F66ED2F
MLFLCLKQKGAPYSTKAGQVEIFNDETDRFCWKKLVIIRKSGAFSTFKDFMYPANFFDAGVKLFSRFDSTAGDLDGAVMRRFRIFAEGSKVEFETVVVRFHRYDVLRTLK